MGNQMTDSQLVKEVLEGNMSAFDSLVNKYSSLVHGLAYHVLGSFQDAEDLAQEAFIKAYDNLSVLKDEAKFGSWLRIITLNLCKMWLRKSKGKAALQPVASATPKDVRIDEELEESVHEALSALSPNNQLVIILFYLQGFSYKQISDFLNLPVSTIQSRLQRARKQLRRRFLEMADQIFQDNRLGSEFTQKVLDEIMTEGRRHLYANQWSEAESSFQKAVGIKPDHAEAHFYMGHAKASQDLYTEAAEWYQKAAELKPDYAQAYSSLALCFGKTDAARMKAYNKAIAAYRKLIELSPDDPEIYKELGEAYTDKGDSENGIAALKQAIALKPDCFEAYAYLGYAYEVKGDIEEAKRIYKKTTEIKVDPERFDNNWEAYRISMAYNNLGAIYFHEEDYHQAIFFMQKAAEKAQELGLGTKSYHRNLAVLYARIGAVQANKGQYAESVSAYKKAIKSFSELQQSGYIKGQIIGGEHLDVIDAFEDFVSQNPEDAEAYYCLACLYSAKGEVGSASKALDKAVELDSDYQEKAEASMFFDSAETKRATN